MEVNKQTSIKHIQGVKYRTILFHAPKFDVVNGFVFDYMHTISLGITSQLFSNWLSSPGEKLSRKNFD